MSRRILIIDDDEGLNKTFCLRLDGAGKVTALQTSRQGLEEIRHTAYDLIFLDLKMPDMNGIETFREIRKIDETVPVYFMSAYLNVFQEQLDQLRREGFYFELLQKPVTGAQVATIVKSLFGEKP